MLNNTYDFLNLAQEIFQAQPFLWYGLFLFIGGCLGSFLGVIWIRYTKIYHFNLMNEAIEYLHDYNSSLFKTKKLKDLLYKIPFTLSSPQSSCDHCGKPIKFYHNIPFFSYLFLNGKCAYCKNKISPAIFFIETIFALCLLSISIKTGVSLEAFIWSIFWFLMAGVFLVDLKTKFIPETFIMPAFLLGIILQLSNYEALPSLQTGILSALVVYLIIATIVKTTSFILKKEAMGGGDLQLFALFGLWLGLNYMLPLIIVSCFMGIVFSIYYKAKEKEEASPFGPSIISAAFIVWLFNIQLMIPGIS